MLWLSCVDANNQISCLFKQRIAFLIRVCCSECSDKRYTKNIFLFFHWDETSYLFLFLAAFFPISFSFFWPQSFNFFPYNQVSMKSYLPSRADCLVLMMRLFFFQSVVNHKCFFNLLLFFCLLSPVLTALNGGFGWPHQESLCHVLLGRRWYNYT